ncbi:MAG: TIGR02449 family protein [Gammaproteobacteria bacterium]|nr:TIGR02449 family protein [Gammaproteobacteria bacterium]
MPDNELKSLESKVNDLVNACMQLKQENLTLRTSQDDLVSERASLIEKTELARNRVEAMISRLKSLEENT